MDKKELRIKLSEIITWTEPILPIMISLRGAGIDINKEIEFFQDYKTEEIVYQQ